MDHLKVAELLDLADSVINGEGLTNTQRLELAATLELNGQSHLATQVMRQLSKDLSLDLAPSPYSDDGRFGNFQAIWGETNERQFYRLTKALSVRLVVTMDAVKL